MFFVIQEMRKQIQDCHAHNEGIALQSIKSIRTVRSFKADSEEVQRYSKALEELRVIKTRKEIYSITFGIIYKVRCSCLYKLVVLCQNKKTCSVFLSVELKKKTF